MRRSTPHGLAIVYHRQRGLTLLELMVTVLLVGVLATIAIAAYGNWRDRARVAQAVTDIAAMGTRLELHWHDAREFPETLDEVYPDARDPWGNKYQYLRLTDKSSKGHARKDRSLVPINSHFDLYSMGPDGRSVSPLTAKASRDDIVWANDGKFVGKAEDF